MGKFRLHDLERDTVLDLELTAEEFGELKRFLKELKTPAGAADHRTISARNAPPTTDLNAFTPYVTRVIGAASPLFTRPICCSIPSSMRRIFGAREFTTVFWSGVILWSSTG